MKKKILLPIICALVLGYLCANYVLALYTEGNSINNSIIYFLQVGAYKNKELVDDISLDNKIIIKEDNKYYLYIGITSDIKNANRISKIYKDKGINLYIKEKKVDVASFKLELEQYDILLKNAKTFDEINAILKTILATYEERVLNK